MNLEENNTMSKMSQQAIEEMADVNRLTILLEKVENGATINIQVGDTTYPIFGVGDQFYQTARNHIAEALRCVRMKSINESMRILNNLSKEYEEGTANG